MMILICTLFLIILILTLAIVFQTRKSKQNNDHLKKELEDIKKKLSFYTDIEEDSLKLNSKENTEHYSELVKDASKQIKEKLSLDIESENILDEEQDAALRSMLNSNNNFFITGKAGTGKSFLLDVFRYCSQKKFIVLAPTGIAALNVHGLTLHSALGYSNLVNLKIEKINSKSIHLNSEKRMLLNSADIIVIDEISMVRADTFEKIDRILQAISGNKAPFGGKQVLLFGDLFQLPPITKPAEYEFLKKKFGGKHFFYSNAYKTGNFNFIELTINHRQKDDARFFELLNRVRDGSIQENDIDLLKSRILRDESAYDRYTTVLPKKADAEAINEDHMMRLDPPEYCYNLKIIYDKYPDRKHNWESLFPVRFHLRLRKGALIMMVANDPQKHWVNGTLGIIKDLSPETIHVAINGITYEVHPEQFTEQEATFQDDEIKYEDVLKISQYPLVPAYAITIHKSQGQTYNNVICDIEQCFDDGQAYVALSRCTSLEGLHIRGEISKSSIRVDHEVVTFYQSQKR